MPKYHHKVRTNRSEVWNALCQLSSERVKTQFAGGVAISGAEIEQSEASAIDFYSSSQGANNGFQVPRAVLRAKFAAAQRLAEARLDAQGFEA